MRCFVLLNNYVNLGLQIHVFLWKSDIHHFFVSSSYVSKLRYNQVAFWFVNVSNLSNIFFCVRTTLKMLFLLWHVFHDLRITFLVVPLHNIWKQRYNCFVFVCHCKVLFITSQLPYLFVRCNYVFCDVRITLYFGTFELGIVTLQLRFILFVIVTYFFITSQLHYLFVRCSYVFYDVRVTLYFGIFELRMEMMLQSRFVFVRYGDVFFITLHLRYLFVWCSYVFWLC